MIKVIQRLGFQFKEYIILLVFVLISLISVSQSEKPQAKKLKVFAIGSFAIIDELSSSFVSIFTSDISREELKRENAELSLQLSKLRNSALENEELRSMLGMKDTSKFPLISAKIVSKLINKVQGNFIINRGSNSGIVRGMPVINHQGLVGIIIDVSSSYSIVRNLQNTSLNIAVTIQQKNIDGILSFDGRDLIIKNIPTTHEVNVGDKVVTSDFSTIFPPAIPVGVVLKKESNAFGLLHSLTVKPAADIEATNNLFIIGIIPNKEINQLEMNLLKKP